MQGVLLRLLTYFGLKYCTQRSKHNPIARAFTRMWMRMRFYSKLHWWTTASLLYPTPPLPTQELSQSVEEQNADEGRLPVKPDLTTPLLG